MSQSTETTSPKRKSFRLYTALSMLVLAMAAGAGIFAGVAPAAAASLTQDTDARVAAFVVPLTLLLLAIIFEVTRFALRTSLPGETPRRRPARHWGPGRGEG